VKSGSIFAIVLVNVSELEEEQFPVRIQLESRVHPSKRSTTEMPLAVASIGVKNF
jgi:hypothetical protein